MNEPKLDQLIREKMRKYVPDRRIQVLHCGVIVLVSIVIGVLSLPTGQDLANAEHQGFEPWLGVYIAVASLMLYVAWTYFRAAKARKEAHEEFLAALPEKEN